MAKFLRKGNNAPKEPSRFKESLEKLKERLSFLKWLDPFTYVDLFVMPRVKKITDSGAVELLVNVFFALLFAFIIYSALGLIFGTSSPLVIVYSGSMESAFFRGDVMAISKANSADFFGPEVFIDRNISGVAVYDYVSPKYSQAQLVSLVFKDTNTEVPYEKTGSVVVYNSYPSNLPIIHRAIVKINASDGVFILTKGDNALTNNTFDQDCGAFSSAPLRQCITYYAVNVNQLAGKSFFIIPKAGCIKLWLFDDFSSLIGTGSLPRDFKGIC